MKNQPISQMILKNKKGTEAKPFPHYKNKKQKTSSGWKEPLNYNGW